MTTLSPQLSYKLETHYDKIASMYNEGYGLEEIREYVGITDTDMQQLEEVMFNMFPIYTVTDMDGNEKVMRFNAHTLQSKEVIYEY